MTQPAILTSMAEVSELARRLADQPSIAVDLEADSLHNYRDKICLIQVSTPTETVLIDALLFEHLEPLRPVFANAGIRKLFHAGDYDLRCLHRDFSLEIHGLFDTMIAAQLLGEARIGLADLLGRHFDVQLDKRFQRADWSQRPLPTEMIDYAAEDTRHLHRLAALFETRLIERERLDWATEEFALLEQVRFDPPTGPLCLRLKGAGQLDRRQLGVLEALLQWRETEGRRRDRPVFKVIANPLLLEIARHAPQSEAALASIDGVPERLRQRFGKALLKAVRRGLECPEQELPFLPKSARAERDPVVEQALKALKSWRAGQAAALEIEPGVLINNAVLEELARQRPTAVAGLEEIHGMKNWQRRVLGESLLQRLGGLGLPPA
ncbi:MAG: HRDC domain-containing protein [Desulfuromonadales bacterium]|nr:HRDC domain-containing protein [Desulfuromonadales bacterium]